MIALLINPENPGAERQSRGMQEAVHAKGWQVQIKEARTEAEIDASFASLAQMYTDILVVGADAFFNSRRGQIVALASRYALPAIYEWREFVEAGGLMSYGPSLSSINHQIGIYIGKILNGAKPADLPVQQPTKFELVINLKAANALGLTVPQALLARADEVIE